MKFQTLLNKVQWRVRVFYQSIVIFNVLGLNMPSILCLRRANGGNRIKRLLNKTKTKSMNTNDIRRNLYKVLRKTGVPRDRIIEDATFSNDMLMDEIDMTCFLFYLETSFNLDIENDALPKIISVRSTIDFLKNRCA